MFVISQTRERFRSNAVCRVWMERRYIMKKDQMKDKKTNKKGQKEKKQTPFDKLADFTSQPGSLFGPLHMKEKRKRFW